MQSLTEKIFVLSPPGGLFNETVIRNVFPESSEGACALLVNRACKAGEILRLKPGLFLLAPPYRKSEPHPFVVAAALHAPSHISLDSALSYHGLIPEAVYQVSSVTVGRRRQFSTPIGVFDFRCVPVYNSRAGVETVEVARNAWAFIASPLRAIADAVYLNRHITWKRDRVGFLTESLRIEEDDLQRLSFDGLDEVLDSFGNLRVQNYLKGLKGVLDHAG